MGQHQISHDGEQVLTLPPLPEAQAKASVLPGLAGTTSAAFCALWPHERFGLLAPFTGSTSLIWRIGLSAVTHG